MNGDLIFSFLYFGTVARMATAVPSSASWREISEEPDDFDPEKCGLLPRSLSRIVAQSAGVASFAYQSRPAGTRPRFCTAMLEFPVRISHSAPELPIDSSQPGSLRPFVCVSFAWLL